MHTGRKIIGLLLIALLGLPTLFGVIWAVGLIRGSISSEFLTELPREIIADVPGTAEKIFRDAQDERYVDDPNTRAWFQAMAKAGVSPRDLMERTGLLSWMKGELSDSVRTLGSMLRGERPARPITIDLRPLKRAILSPEVGMALEATLASLPPCDEKGQETWARIARREPGYDALPACRPVQAVSEEVLLYARTEAIRDMPDDVKVLEGSEHFPFLPFGLSGFITVTSFFLFLIPAAFIFVGALIGGSTPAGVFRWSGVSVFAGGAPALLLGLASKYLSFWAIKAAPVFNGRGGRTGLGELVLDKARWIPARVVDQLFSPVIGVAAVVCLLGVVLYALSFSVRNTPRKAAVPAAPPAPAPERPKSGGEAR
jgi:hypothetical protein